MVSITSCKHHFTRGWRSPSALLVQINVLSSMRGLIAFSVGVFIASCDYPQDGVAPVVVSASGETEPVETINKDAADDIAIWRNNVDPSKSLIVATDKQSGLIVYDLAGRKRFFENSGRLNNVDLIQQPDGRVIVVASNRNDKANAILSLSMLDPELGSLLPIGNVAAGEGEAYGVCLYQAGGNLIAYSVMKNGSIVELEIDIAAASQATILRRMSTPTQAEGCVVDPSNGALYVAEEDGGIWRFEAGQTEGELVIPVDNRYLVADVEGLALAHDEGRTLLIASSQGDDAFSVFDLPSGRPLGRFIIGAGVFGAVEETDGIEISVGSLGNSYPEGLFVAQDGQNDPDGQNFKLVSWAEIKREIEL
jgi:3-phytase